MDEPMSPSSGGSKRHPGALRTFAEKLDHLFKQVHPPDRAPYSVAEVAQALADDPATRISEVYVWQLRSGRKDNPTIRHVRALASFFRVPASYFLDDAETDRIAADLAIMSALRGGQVAGVAMRAAGLSPAGLQQVAAMIDLARRAEGLPPAPDDAGGDATPGADGGDGAS